jgi:hypothetical protein
VTTLLARLICGEDQLRDLGAEIRQVDGHMVYPVYDKDGLSGNLMLFVGRLGADKNRMSEWMQVAITSDYSPDAVWEKVIEAAKACTA